MKKINNKKGFTLAELLIVVAIIAVLVAISIPIFSAQLEKAREATDLANIRSAYAEASVEVLDKNEDSTKTVKLRQQVNEWVTSNPECAGFPLSNDIAVKDKSVKVTVHADGSDPTFELVN